MVDDGDAAGAADVRFGLIGAGRWGQCHSSAIARAPGATLAAVATAGAASARQASAQLGVPAYPSWESMLDDHQKLGLSAVDIVAPNALHAPIACAALESGLHVLVEKPLATTLQDGRRVVETALATNRTVAVGHELRLSSLWAAVKERIDEGCIGTPRAMTTSLFRRSFRAGSGGWRHDPARVGSWLLEEPVHFLDLARWYFARNGEPTSVYARANGREERLPESFFALIEFEDGGYASVAQTLKGAEHHIVAEITGTEGALRVTWSGESDRSRTPQCRLVLASGDVAEDLPLSEIPAEEQALQREIDDMIRSLQCGTEPLTSARDGLWAVMLALAAEESALSGQPVELPMS